MSLPEGYVNFLETLKLKIRQSRQKAVLSVNRELLMIYWEIGNAILRQQELTGWGGKVIDRISADLKIDFPDFKGLSVRNLKYMQAFAKAYPDFGQIHGGHEQTIEKQHQEIVQVPLAQLTWYHHITLLDKVKQPEIRLFYIHKCVENGWSREVMVHQIETGLHLRIGKSITNFKQTLPDYQSDLAQQTIKNPYVLDFLNLTEDIKEKDLEKALINGIKNFLLELGNGFAFVENQKKLIVEEDEFFLDLLFYNYKLHCFVVVELKVGDFKPEFAGKLNFYVNVVNDQLRSEADNPTIGILLCKTPNETVVKFALQDIKQPIGVSEYHLQNALPDKLQIGIPSVEELEAELEKEYEELKSPVDNKLESIKSLLKNLDQKQQLEVLKNDQLVVKIFHEFFKPLAEQIHAEIQEKIADLFAEFRFVLSVNFHDFDTLTDAELLVTKPLLSETEEKVTRLALLAHGLGFKAAGSRAFDYWQRLSIHFDPYAMRIGVHESKGDDLWLKKMYHEIRDEKEIKHMSARFIEYWLDGLTELVKKLTDKQ